MQYVIKSVGSVLKAVCECTEGSDRKYVISTTCFLFVLFFLKKKKGCSAAFPPQLRT